MFDIDFNPLDNPFDFVEEEDSVEELERQLQDFNNIPLPELPSAELIEDDDVLPSIPDNKLETIVRVDTSDIEVSDGNFTGFDFDQEEFEKVNDAPPKDVVIPSDFSIKPTLEAEHFDDFSILAEGKLTYPYLVFSASGNLKTVSSLCSGILKRGDVQLYFRPEADNPNKLIPVISVATTPINIMNLLRLSRKDSVYYRVNEESVERLARPEQFIRHIDLGLSEDDSYWNSLIEEEQGNVSSNKPFIAEDLFA